MKRPKHRKGEIGSDVLKWSMTIGGGVMVIAVLAIVLGAFRDSSICPQGYSQNSTAGNCYLDSNHATKAGYTMEANISGRGLTFLDNSTSKFGTAGTILGVLLLLGLVAGIGYFGYNKIRN